EYLREGRQASGLCRRGVWLHENEGLAMPRQYRLQLLRRELSLSLPRARPHRFLCKFRYNNHTFFFGFGIPQDDFGESLLCLSLQRSTDLERFSNGACHRTKMSLFSNAFQTVETSFVKGEDHSLCLGHCVCPSWR